MFNIFYYIIVMEIQFEECIGAKLRKLSRIVDGYYRKNLSNVDITEKQVTILLAINTLKKIEQGKIGKLLVLERSTVSRNVRLLEKKNLVERTNFYRPEIQLTPKGQDMVSRLLPIWEGVMDDLHNKLGSDGIKLMEELEKKLT